MPLRSQDPVLVRFCSCQTCQTEVILSLHAHLIGDSLVYFAPILAGAPQCLWSLILELPVPCTLSMAFRIKHSQTCA
jgi:hypothetical protein